MPQFMQPNGQEVLFAGTGKVSVRIERLAEIESASSITRGTRRVDASRGMLKYQTGTNALVLKKQ